MRASHLLAMAACLLPAAVASAMDNGDLIKLKQAAFSDDTIIHTIDKEPPNYDTSPSALISLKNAGVSEKVINHVLAKQNNVPPAAEPAPQSVTAPVVQDRSAPPATTSGPAVVTSAPAPAAAEAVAMPAPSEPNLFSIESPSIAPPFEQIRPNQDYFTRFSFHVEGDTYVATNYFRGVLIPINTPVHVTAISNRKIALKRLDTGEAIYVENVEKYTHKTPAEIASLMFSSVKTPIDRLAPPIAIAIATGELRKGMTKEQVLLARGYPPAHETPSTDSDRWKYWSSRFVTQTIVFANGRLAEGRDIP